MSCIQREGVTSDALDSSRASCDGTSALVDRRIQDVVYKQLRLSEVIAKVGAPDTSLHVSRLHQEGLLHPSSVPVSLSEVDAQHIMKLLRDELHKTAIIHHHLLDEKLPSSLIVVGTVPGSLSQLMVQYKELREIQKRLCQKEMNADLASMLQQKGLDSRASLCVLLKALHEKIEAIHQQLVEQQVQGEQAPFELGSSLETTKVQLEHILNKAQARDLVHMQCDLKNAVGSDSINASHALKSLRCSLTTISGMDETSLSTENILQMARKQVRTLERNQPNEVLHLEAYLQAMHPSSILALAKKDPQLIVKLLLFAVDIDNIGILKTLFGAHVAINTLVHGDALLSSAERMHKSNVSHYLQEVCGLVSTHVESALPQIESAVPISDPGDVRVFDQMIERKIQELELAKIDVALASSKNSDDVHFVGTELGLDNASQSLILNAAQNKVKKLQMDIYRMYVQFLEKNAQHREHLLHKCIEVAFQLDQVELLKVLRDIHVDPNALTSKGCTLVTRAIAENKLDFVRVLVEDLHVDVNQPDELGRTPLLLSFMRKNPQITELLMHCGANFEETESLLKTKGMALLFALGSNKKDIEYHCGRYTLHLPLQGFTSDMALYFLEDLFKKWEREVSLDCLTQSERERIQSIIEQAVQDFGFSDSPTTSAILAERIQSGQPVLMQSNVFAGHNIGLFFHKNRFYVCNRGFGASKHAIEVFEMQDRSLFTKESIDQIREAHFRTKKKFEVLLSSLHVSHVGNIDQHWQQVGNCSWANLKSAFLAVLYDTLEERIPDPSARLLESKRLKAMFTRFGSTTFLNEYLSCTPYPSKEVVALAREVIQKPDFHHFTWKDQTESTQKIDAFLARAE